MTMGTADAFRGPLDGRAAPARPTLDGFETYPVPWRLGWRVITEDYARGVHSVSHDGAEPRELGGLIRPSVKSVGAPVVRASDGSVVCVFEGNPYGVDRLIIAAPDLLAALTDLRAACEEAYKAGRIPAEPFVRAGNVIAKATEESVSPLGLFATNRPQEDK